MAIKTVAITGTTYPVKDQLKALGGRWDGAAKAWMVPADTADQARALVASAPQGYVAPSNSSYRSRSYRSYGSARRTGCSCGSIEGRSRSSDCASCRFDEEDQ